MSLRRVGVAALFAAATMLGTTTGTLADPATACAAPDRDRYYRCLRVANEQFVNGVLTQEQWEQKRVDCCYEASGEFSFGDGFPIADCVDPDTGEPVSFPAPPRFGDLTQVPGGQIEATLTPLPPPIATVAPNLPPAQIG